MFGTRTLRGRLTLSYAAALTLGLIAFAIVALFTVDAVQRRLVDDELWEVARTETATVEYSAAPDAISASDAARFASVAGSRVASALIGQDGRTLVASAARIPEIIVRSAGAADSTVISTLYDGSTALRTVDVPMTRDGLRGPTIAVWSDIASIASLDEKIAIAFFVTIPLLVGLATLGGSAIARRNLAPLDRIIRDASEIEARNLGARVTLAEPSELRLLAVTLNRMLGRLGDAFERERRFTSDASHEFRAPLAVILAEADLALSVPREPAQYQRALETIAIEADALEVLTRGLLATTRSDVSVLPSTEQADLVEIAAMAASRMRILADQRAVTVHTQFVDEAIVIGCSTQIEQAAITIIHNAIKYARLEGHIFVKVHAVEGQVELRVTDDGPGFSDAALIHAFARFWREEATDIRMGHGLGLSIARSIVQSYGGTVVISNDVSGAGAVVSIVFPRAVQNICSVG